MKKTFPLAVLIACLFLNFPIYASNANIFNGSITDIVCEINTLELTPSTEPLADADTLNVTKQVTYSGIVTPSNSIEWRETIDETVFIGTLYLHSYYQTSDNTTIATYKGTLYRE